MLATIPTSVEKKIIRDQRNLLRMIANRHAKIDELSGNPNSLANRLALTAAFAELSVLQDAIVEANHEAIEEFTTLAHGISVDPDEEEEVA